MKKIVLLFLFFSSVALSQTRGISYQALIIDPITQELPGFNNSNAPLANKDICLKFSFIDELNTLEYEEIFSVRTDNYGMVNLIIGTEVRTGGYALSFEDIQWSLLPKNLKIDLSTDGCSTFTEISNAPFTAVPFALFTVNTVDNPLILDNQREIALLRDLIIATLIGVGLDADGGYTPEATTFFIKDVTSLKEADIVLDNQVNTNENNINTNTVSITTNTSNISTNTTDIATKVNITDIVDDLITGGTTVPLSAEQGKVLKGLIDSSVKIIVEDVLTSSSTMNALSANQGRELIGLIEANASNISGAVMTTGDQTIDGAKTFSSTIVGNINGNAATATTTTGNAATATALETARTIGGVSFDGTANIDLPGVNTAGNQDTSGNAATATLASTLAVNSSSNNTNAATGSSQYSAIANIGAGSRTFSSINTSNTFNAGIDLSANSIVTITLTKIVNWTNGPTTYDVQPVITSIDSTNNTFTITTYVSGTMVKPNNDFTFNFLVIK